MRFYAYMCIALGITVLCVDIVRLFVVLQGQPPTFGQGFLLITVGLIALKVDRGLP